jgi:hypothetical protein
MAALEVGLVVLQVMNLVATVTAFYGVGGAVEGRAVFQHI